MARGAPAGPAAPWAGWGEEAETGVASPRGDRGDPGETRPEGASSTAPGTGSAPTREYPAAAHVPVPTGHHPRSRPGRGGLSQNRLLGLPRKHLAPGTEGGMGSLRGLWVKGQPDPHPSVGAVPQALPLCPLSTCSAARASQCHPSWNAVPLSRSGLTGICPQGLWKPELCLENGVQPVQGAQTGGVPPAPLPSSRYVRGESQPHFPTGHPRPSLGLPGEWLGQLQELPGLHPSMSQDMEAGSTISPVLPGCGGLSAAPRLPRALLQHE